ncbi:MAG: type II toxin-antitoxin system Y4mF family antitoxin [Candidatus Omnitrophica bacterium]|nr:type II toxin-antitoxin system Y4mF family antitoxin [Candidatus Omnitrophota bacterium]
MANMVFQIKELRKKIGLTQVEFAKRAGVGLRFLRELEQGKATVRMDKLVRVLDFLGYHLELRKNEAK